MQDKTDIRDNGKNSLDLVSFLEDFQKEFAALKNTIQGKDLRISSFGTSLEKLQKSYQK